MPPKRTSSGLEVGRMQVRKHTPYLYKAVYGLIPHATEEVETLGVTPGMVMYYNPKYLAALSDSECGGVQLHEGLHPYLKHSERQGLREHTRWNYAGDLHINNMIAKTGLALPLGCVFPCTFDLPEDQTTEWYYDHLPAKVGHKESNAAGKGDCGGCAGKGSKNKELEERLDREFGRSAADKARIAKQVAVDITAHAREHGRGSVPGTLLAWADILLAPPAVSWEAELSSNVRTAYGQLEAGGQDYSLARPSKRSIVRGMIRPGLVDYQPEILVVLDTSGSMGGPAGIQIQSGLRETAGILCSLGLEHLWFLEADADVALQPKRISVASLRHIEIRGGGGTDFGPAIEAGQRLQPKPSLLVYFTDGDGACPSHAPWDMQVIWAIVPGRWSVKHPLPWGKTIWIKE